ncbi:MAG TPA: NAD-dependent epimerase/dehydratase family protein [Thermoleophilaceae bacterium]|nr:NAD-dependent epimerase/dehydratase family protein [Thermoleophilaceae bacterium]
MMRQGRVVVTGCAGFIGSHLCERLVEQGREVIGIDCFTNYYPRERKERNLALLREVPAFTLIEADLASAPLDGLLEGIDTVFHLAAQAGVRGSFGESFRDYVNANVLTTQRLLEQAVKTPVGAFVYASSSSVYGDAPAYPTHEQTERRPVSPYGMTKVATEELAGVYQRCFGVPVVGLRYFTAYGPRQRPDMAFWRFLHCALGGTPLPLNGDGCQVRDFTFVDDVVDGTLAAARLGRMGAVYNVGGGSPVALIDAVRLIGELVGRQIEVAHVPAPVGDPRCTGCDPSLAMAELGFVPQTPLRDGLAAQLEWMLAEEGPDTRELIAAGVRA